ncbi:lysozyme [Phyllobacterium phragmitis]|uniref:Lysozyme n=1 Tax=Phyllobacterium phragmitis TaxID=2670329 RepID=A0A2S9INU4_9HYPH|nr:lysozyme [Phyllobacterium phragmitis]PRD42193.1 lysozyme [Phyllobacterium phragmitis]
MNKSRLKKNSALAAMVVAAVGGFEGLRLNAYPDPATKGPPWTVCYGSTHGVKRGDSHSLAECKAMLVKDLEIYANGIERCVTAPLPDARYVALVSFAYNVGPGAACKSSVVRLINQGRTRQGCDALLKWNRAAGIVFPGLTNRRKKERVLCLAGLK